MTVGTSTFPIARNTTPAWEVLTDLPSLERLSPEWSELLSRIEHQEMAHTPDWLLTWWQIYGQLADRKLRVGILRDGERLIGIVPLLARSFSYRGIVPFRRLEFLASGEPDEDGIYTNHLSFVAEGGKEERVARQFVEALRRGSFGAWDEVVLPMMSHDTPWPAFLEEISREAGYRVEITQHASAPYVPLPKSWDIYLQGLSSNGRRNVQRSIRALEKWSNGTLQFENASNAVGLDRAKEALIQLHHERWSSDNRPGVFRSPLYLQFHNAIMTQLAQKGLLEIYWLKAHEEPIAALYGMRWGSKIYAYQTGRRTDLPSRLRPGGVLMALAIRQAIERGLGEFDLMSDTCFYKQQLTSYTRKMLQVRIARHTLVEGVRWSAAGLIAGLRKVRKRWNHS